MEKLVIDRLKWRRGGDRIEKINNFGYTQLLNKEGYMCCLGFECLRRGIPEDDILDIGEPCEVATDIDYFFEFANSPFINEAIRINDDMEMDDREREEVLTDLFLKEGIQVEFIN